MHLYNAHKIIIYFILACHPKWFDFGKTCVFNTKKVRSLAGGRTFVQRTFVQGKHFIAACQRREREINLGFCGCYTIKIIGQMPVGKMSVGEMPVGQMPVGQMPVRQIPYNLPTLWSTPGGREF